jgi:hypothetical protein
MDGRHHHFAHELNPATGRQNGYGTWDQFLTHFEEAFNPIDSAGTALHKLHALKQGNNLSKYISTFKQLCNRAEINSFNAQKDYFIRGLKPALLSKLCNSRDIPSNMEGMYKKVISIENAYQLLLSHRTLTSESRNRSTDRRCHIPYIRASHPKFRMSDPIRSNPQIRTGSVMISFFIHILFI